MFIFSTIKKTFLLLLLCVGSMGVFAQVDPVPPYKKTLKIPEFVIRNVADSSVFTQMNLKKNTKTILVYFGPDCGHCVFFAKKLMDSISLFKNTQIVMVSSFEYDHIKKFYEDNKLADCPFITVGRDKDYFFISHFGVRQFPSAYVYNKKGTFVKHLESDIDIMELSKIK